MVSAFIRLRTCAVVGLSLVCAPALLAQRGAPRQTLDPARLTADEMRADLALFRSDFVARAPAYSAAARAEAEARLDRLQARTNGIDLVAFELELARVAALADDGHTVVAAVVQADWYPAVPVRLAPFGDEFHVVRATVEHEDLLGARLVSVDGHPLAELRDSARALSGGIQARRDRSAGFVLETPAMLHALGLAREPERATYGFRSADGKEIRRQLAGEPRPSEPWLRIDRWLFPDPYPGEGGRWRALASTTPASWAYADAEEAFRWRAVPELDLMVVELRQNHDASGRKIADFLSDVTRELETRRPRNLVVDLRHNRGGNLQTTREFMADLPRRVPGRIFALTSPWTFSAGISSVAYLEQAAPDRVTVVGEGVGDRLEFWAEERWRTLPRSGIRLVYGGERHDYRNGCRGRSDCHATVAEHPIAITSLEPDILAPWTIDAYRSGRDPAIEAVERVLRDATAGARSRR